MPFEYHRLGLLIIFSLMGIPTGKGDMFGESKKQITKEQAIKALFGDKADEVVSYLLDAIKNPFLRAVMYTRVSEYKEQHKDLYDKTGEDSMT